MPRDIPIGNGSFLLNFDADYCLRDIYFPCCGGENHTAGHKFRFGVWADGAFSWVNRDWKLRLDYTWESLVTHVVAENPSLGLRLHLADCVDYRENIYVKKIEAFNLLPRERELRLFFHHDFHIYETADSDTAYYDPHEEAFIHYKRDRYFLACCMREGKPVIDQFTAGVKEFRGLEGTWRDAEDGLLAGNPIAQGSVDSVISVSIELPASGQATAYYWMAAGGEYRQVSGLNRLVKSAGPEAFIDRTDRYWRAWVNKEGFLIKHLPARVANLFRRSLLLMRTNIDNGGAVLAALDSDTKLFARDTYSYMWPRDGALTAYALDKSGFPVISRKFFEFCQKIVEGGKESEGYFLHKYNADGCLGSSWHAWVKDGRKQLPIQEDGTGLVLWALWNHYDTYRDIEFVSAMYEPLIVRCADFLSSYRDAGTGLPLPSYDLWEESWGVHTYTASAVVAGIRAAENFALLFEDNGRAERYRDSARQIRDAMRSYLYDEKQKRFLKSLIPNGDGTFSKDTAVDASTYAPFYFGVFPADDEMVVNTMNAIRERLWVRTKTGGIARYEGDMYYRDKAHDGVPGNPWFICTLWFAQWLIAKAKTPEELSEAVPVLEWVTDRALPSGVLAEQINPFTNEPLSASPLTWSHATLVATILEYLEKLEGLDVCPTCGSPLYSHKRGFAHMTSK